MALAAATGGVLFCPPPVFAHRGGRTGDAGNPGEKIGEGVSADVHAWAPGQVVKLFKAGVPQRTSRWEARMTRAAFAAGAPEVFDEVTLEGRFGIVLQRLDGPTLEQLRQTRAVTSGQVGAILAALYTSVHRTPPPPDVASLRDWIDAVSRTSRDILPEHIATGVLTLIDRLPPEDGLCHADLHPGNVIMTADGPRIIDWSLAVRASGVFDIARAHVCLSELVPEDVRSGAAARNQCRRAVRVRAAGRHVPRGADGGDAAISAHPSRLRPPPAAAGHPCPAGAADPAHRSGPALGGLKFARDPRVVCPATRQCPRWVISRRRRAQTRSSFYAQERTSSARSFLAGRQLKPMSNSPMGCYGTSAFRAKNGYRRRDGARPLRANKSPPLAAIRGLRSDFIAISCSGGRETVAAFPCFIR